MTNTEPDRGSEAGPSPLALEYARARATGDRAGMVRVFGELFGADAAATFGEVLLDAASAAGEPDGDQDAGAAHVPAGPAGAGG